MKKVKFLEFIVLSGFLVGAVVISLMNQTSASAKTDNDYQYNNVIFGFKNKKNKKVRTFLLIRCQKLLKLQM